MLRYDRQIKPGLVAL